MRVGFHDCLYKVSCPARPPLLQTLYQNQIWCENLRTVMDHPQAGWVLFTHRFLRVLHPWLFILYFCTCMTYYFEDLLEHAMHTFRLYGIYLTYSPIHFFLRPSLLVLRSSIPDLRQSIPVLRPSLPVLHPSLPVLRPSIPVFLQSIPPSLPIHSRFSPSIPTLLRPSIHSRSSPIHSRASSPIHSFTFFANPFPHFFAHLFIHVLLPSINVLFPSNLPLFSPIHSRHEREVYHVKGKLVIASKHHLHSHIKEFTHADSSAVQVLFEVHALALPEIPSLQLL
jgi:hypothetical protein